MKDDDILCEAANRIDNAIFEAIKAVAHDGKSLEWDMGLIGPVVDFIENTLRASDITTCYPWQDENENICYSTDERCRYCQRDITKR